LPLPFSRPCFVCSPPPLVFLPFPRFQSYAYTPFPKDCSVAVAPVFFFFLFVSCFPFAPPPLCCAGPPLHVTFWGGWPFFFLLFVFFCIFGGGRKLSVAPSPHSSLYFLFFFFQGVLYRVGELFCLFLPPFVLLGVPLFFSPPPPLSVFLAFCSARTL